MATKTPSVPADPNTVVLSQQALNIARQIVAAPGWAKTVEYIYIGGKLLAETLPQLDPLDWVQTDEQIKAMTPTHRTAYLKQDRAWIAEKKTFTVTAKEKEAFRAAFEYFAAENKVAPNQYISEVIRAFRLVKEE